MGGLFFGGVHEIHIWIIIVDSWTCGMNHFKFISAIIKHF